jgi:hypothetical protein
MLSIPVGPILIGWAAAASSSNWARLGSRCRFRGACGPWGPIPGA